MSKKRQEKLMEYIYGFLAEHRDSDGGWAPVTEQDLVQLDAIICLLIEAKWSPDTDGDRPISYRIVDRTREELPQALVLPLIRGAAGTEEAWDRYIDLAATNVSMAAQRLEMGIKLKQMLKNGKSK